MKQFVVLLLSVCILSACKEKKTSLTDDADADVVEASDFVEFFPDATLPVMVADSTLVKKTSDSLRIGYKIFTQFVPDTVLTRDFGKSNEVRIFPIGKVREKGKETYLFVKAVLGSKRMGYLMCFDKDDNYLNTIRLVSTGVTKWSNAYGVLDKKFQITTYREQKKGDEIDFKRNVYIYNSADTAFTLILTEPNEEMIAGVYNPIDTLPRKHKLAGDFRQNERNFISFRDGKNESELLFFVHFEKDKGECIGELKGTAKVIGENKVQFSEMGNPCKIEFTISKNNVEMKELEGCGSFRDIKCFFEGRFPRKKEAPAKKAK